MKEIIYITGHKNPDTDSICSAIAYAEFKNKTQRVTAVPIRLGKLSSETQFVLDYFGVEKPMLVNTVKAQVSDLNIDKVTPISEEISLEMAWNIMKKNNVRTLPVVNEDNNLTGIVTVSSITSSCMDVWDNTILAKSGTKLENILDTLAAEAILVNGTSPEFNGKIVVAAMQPSSISNIIEQGDIAICGDRIEIQNVLIDSGVSLIIITGNHEASEDIVKKAGSAGCTIIKTPYDTFTAARLIIQSIPVSHVMSKENLVSFRTDDFIDEIRDIILETRYRSYPVINKENSVVGSVSRYHLISKNKKKVILLDHNEKSQSVNGLEDAEVLEIIDHHRVADIQTGIPIYFRNEPVGSTATIIATIYFENGIRPSKTVAGLLCAAIISDTLFFKSPTSTMVDQMILKRLAEIADIDMESFAKEMFKAGTSLKNKTPEEIFHQDFKTVTLGNMKIGISQIGTMDREGFLPLKENLLSLMEKKASENSFSMLIFMLTDILGEGSELLVAGKEKEIVSRAFEKKLVGNTVYLPGILSRKKQIIPPLANAIANVK